MCSKDQFLAIRWVGEALLSLKNNKHMIDSVFILTCYTYLFLFPKIIFGRVGWKAVQVRWYVKFFMHFNFT